VIGGRASEISYIDMRYSNGFAIGWKRASGLASGDGSSKPSRGALPPRSPA
jgi:hypothetical protein